MQKMRAALLLEPMVALSNAQLFLKFALTEQRMFSGIHSILQNLRT